jgi:hypothetical protein
MYLKILKTVLLVYIQVYKKYCIKNISKCTFKKLYGPHESLGSEFLTPLNLSGWMTYELEEKLILIFLTLAFDVCSAKIVVLA